MGNRGQGRLSGLKARIRITPFCSCQCHLRKHRVGRGVKVALAWNEGTLRSIRDFKIFFEEMKRRGPLMTKALISTDYTEDFVC